MCDTRPGLAPSMGYTNQGGYLSPHYRCGVGQAAINRVVLRLLLIAEPAKSDRERLLRADEKEGR